MVKNSHLGEGGGLSSTSGMSALVLVCTHRKAIILESFMLSLVLVLHWKTFNLYIPTLLTLYKSNT
jgi:hypothetical protein